MVGCSSSGVSGISERSAAAGELSDGAGSRSGGTSSEGAGSGDGMSAGGMGSRPGGGAIVGDDADGVGSSLALLIRAGSYRQPAVRV